MKKISIFLIAVMLITGVVGFGGCNEEANEPAIFSYGGNTTVMSQTISPMGGTIEAGHSGTPIDGIEVEFPEGALTEDTNISLGYNTGTLTPNEGIYAGVAFTIDTGNVAQFEQAVIVTAPFENIDGTPVPYYVDSDGRLHPTVLLEVDRATETFTFAVFHTSTFTWIVSLLAGSEALTTTLSAPVRVNYHTGYSPSHDGFQIDNEGTEYTGGGECFGMSAFSTWYFMQKKYQHVEENLYPSYMEEIDTDAEGNPLYGQDIIATRAHIAIGQVWDTSYSGPVSRALALSDADKWASITSAMENTAAPVLVYLPKNIPIFTGPHAVVAFSYTNSRIFIYDPNHEGESRYIEYDMSDRSFHWYGLYDDLTLLGDYHSIANEPEEPYENILEDADANFHGSGIATIVVTSHTMGQEVTEPSIVLAGNIESGQVLVTELEVWREPYLYSMNIEPDGSFNLPIDLENGINHLQFVTKGNDSDGNLIEVPNNMADVDFTITADLEKYDLTISSTAGGSTTPEEGTHNYNAGTVVPIVATADPGYYLVEWTGSNVDTIDDVYDPTTTITMNDDYSITANFEEIPTEGFDLTISSTTGGSTTPEEGTYTYDAGTEVPIVATTDPGYYFAEWTGNVGTIADVNDASTTITMNDDYSITANFEESTDVSLKLYVLENSPSGPIITGVLVTGYDGDSNYFSETTNSAGYVTITGVPGLWSFTASKAGYQTKSWSQSTTIAETRYVYLLKESTASLEEALDNTDFTFMTGGDTDWFGQTAVSFYDGDAAQSGPISDDGWTYLWVTVIGPGYLTFYCKVDSAPGDEFRVTVDGVTMAAIEGSCDWQWVELYIDPDPHIVHWIYQKDASGSGGSDFCWVDKVEFSTTNPPSPLQEAVDNTGLSFMTGCDTNWFEQTTVSFYDGDAAQSGPIGDNGWTSFWAPVTGPGYLTFYCKVNSAPGDEFRLRVGGVTRAVIEGPFDWDLIELYIDPGTYIVEWIYQKDASGSGGSDCCWVDKVEFTPSS